MGRRANAVNGGEAAGESGLRPNLTGDLDELLGIRPMMSVASAQIVLRGPDESVQPLLWLRKYRMSWNRTFLFREPVMVPKGSVVRATPGIPLEFLIRKR